MAVKVHTLIYKGADGEGGKYYTQLLSGKTPKHVLPDTDILLWLTDHTDSTDFLTRATCFSTTEITDLTDFVSIACSLRY